MGNPWEANYASEDSGAAPWDKTYIPAGEKKVNRTARDVVSDLGVSFAGGANALVEGLGTLYGMTTGDMDNFAREQGESGRKYWEAKKSEALKADEAARRAAIDSADGELAKAGTAFWETVKNPALLSSFAAEQIPMFLPIGMAGRAGSVAAASTGIAGKVATVAEKGASLASNKGGIVERIAKKGLAGISTKEGAAGAIGTSTAIGTGATLQGADVGGDAYTELLKLPESLWEKNAEYQALRSELGDQKAKEQIALDLSKQAAGEGGVASVLTNLLPFARTFERVTAGAPAKLTGNVVSRAAKGAAGESIQEASEEGLGRVSVNRAVGDVDPNRSLTEGVGEAAGMGAAGGVVMGGTFGAMSKEDEPKAVEPTANGQGPAIGVPTGAERVDTVLGTPEAVTPYPNAAPGSLASAANIAAKNKLTPQDASILPEQGASSMAQTVGAAAASPMDQSAPPISNNDVVPSKHVGIAGNDSEVVLPDNSSLPAKWEVVDADQIAATMKEGKNQPRDRSRAASNVQVQGIANNPDYRRLSDSPVMDVGAPTITHDGVIVGGNGRFEGVSRAYDQGTAGDYLTRLKADAAAKGIDPASIDGIKKPVLVRRVTQPFDVRSLAVASNSGGSLQYSGLELAKIDAERMGDLSDIQIADNGDIAMAGTNASAIKRATRGYSAAELGSFTDADGALSQEGARRVRNAILYQAYGNTPALTRLVESNDSDLRSVSGALLRAASTVASSRSDMKDGKVPAELDILPELVAAIEALSKIKADGSSVKEFLAQQAMFGEISQLSKDLLQYIDDNIRSQKRIAELIKSYYDAAAQIDLSTSDIFGKRDLPSKQEVIDNAKQTIGATAQTTGLFTDQSSGREDRQKPGDTVLPARSAGEGQKESVVEESATPAQPPAKWWAALSKEQRIAAISSAGLNIKPVAAWNFISTQNKEAILGARDKVAAPSGAQAETKQDAPARQQDKIIGRNYEGIMIREDANGVRYIHRNGVKLQEKVLLDGRGGYSVDRTEHPDSDFMPVDQDARAKAKEKIDGALADLGSIFRDVANVQRITPEEKAKLLPALVKLFEGAFELGLYNMKDARAFVRAQLAKFNSKLSKFLDNALMDEAAMQAQKNMPAGFADNQGLFGQPEKKESANDSQAAQSEASSVQPESAKQAGRSDQFTAYENFIKSKGAISPELAQEISRDKSLGTGEVEALLAMGKENAASRENERVQDRMTNADKKLNPDNFKVPPLHTVVSPEIEQKAHYLIAKYKTAERKVTLDPADVKIAEESIAPILAKAEKNFPAFKESIIEIAHAAGIGQMVAGIKRMDRCVSKMLNPADAKKYVVREKIGLFSSRLVSVKAEENLRDTLRATIVVKSYGDADAVISEIRKHFEIDESRHKNRVSNPTAEGYRDHLLNVILPDGLQAEIQINTPEMLAAKDVGHALYEVSQNYSLPEDVRDEASGSQRELYGAAYTASSARSLDTGLLNSGMMPSVNIAISPPIATTLPSGNLTNGDSSSGVKKNLASDGSLATNSGKVLTPSNPTGSGFISGSSKHIVAKNASEVYDGDLFGGENTTEGAKDENGTANTGGAKGEGPAVAGRAKGERKSGSVLAGQDGADLFANQLPGDADSKTSRNGQGRVNAADGDLQQRPAPRKGDRAGRATGVPAGRDIPAKTGRNYRLTDDDLNYQGSWITKAAQNVEAIELVKKLEAEKRDATREEQAVLAKFIGWGASEIRNNIFDKRVDAQVELVEQYEKAIAEMEQKGRDYLEQSGRFTRGDVNFYPAYMVLRAKEPGLNYYSTNRITKEQLQKARPDMNAKKWVELRDRLKAVMTEEEWSTAERSTQYAHYTGKEVVDELWRAVGRMGFKGGLVIEPGAGNGVFPGRMPAEVGANISYTGIEMDALTGAILKRLQPDERILVESYIESQLPDNFYDVAIGNPPFSATKIVSDPRYKKHAFALHDYFFAKTIDKVKPGGLMVFVTSRYTMDKHGDKARNYLSERADLLGAIRLPETAFKKNAGTEVVTDILFLRKKVPGEVFEGHKWGGLEKIKVKGGEHLINEYFAAHPEMVLGEGSIDKNGMYAKDQYTVLPSKDAPISELLAKAIDALPKDVYRPEVNTAAHEAKVREFDWNPKAKKEGSYYVSDDGQIMQVENRVGVPAKIQAKNIPLMKSFISLRDAINQAQYDQLNNGEWEKSLEALRKEYKAFVSKNGNILQHTVIERKQKIEDEDGNTTEEVTESRRFDLLNKLDDDPEYTKLLGLEKLNEDTGAITEGDFLKGRVLDARKTAAIVTPSDALLSVLNDTGKVSMPEIAKRIGLSEEEVIESLGTAVYESPSQGWLMADEYLSGNVKQKLKEAEAAAKTDKRYSRNVEALLAVQPRDLTPADVTASLGMNWIPSDVYAQFLMEISGVGADVIYNEALGTYQVKSKSGYRMNNRAEVDWGTPSRHAGDIMEHALTGRPIRITKTVGSGKDAKTMFDADATEAANQKLKAMREEFASWIWREEDRTGKLLRIYNDKFNNIVPRSFDGRHLTLPGTTSAISVFDHVKRGAWRIIQTGNTYLAHAVGSGKTWQMVISAMEQKRLGMINKPMIVVPNHMLQQFAQEWLQLYPAARLLVADEKQFAKENRRRFVARAAMSDLDGVIITQSAFKLIDIDPEFKEKMIREEIEQMEAARDNALEEDGEDDPKKSRNPLVRDIQKRIENLEEQLKAASSSAGKDQNIRFDEMGVDMLYVDEAHLYRKLSFSTARQVKGISPAGSQYSRDLYIKTRWLEEKHPGRSLVMASGTPITNTMAEMYSVQRFMQPKVLEERGLMDFDAWASMFGQESTEIESDVSGNYSPVTRFSKFVNVPELTQMFREFADVLTSEHLAEMLGDKRPKVKYGTRKLVVTPQVDDYLEYKKELADRVKTSKAWKPSRDEPNNPDPMIRIIGDGRLAAIDMRFIDPELPSNPNSKLNVMIDGVIESYRKYEHFEYVGKDGKTEERRGATQMVFSDIGFGEGVAAHRGFDARGWFEKRLRDAGIPISHVAFMSDYKKSEAKRQLFKDVNSGKVRILVGSSKNMGTGVNAQQRLRALHHLDTPWFPADLEQREGRIIRQGNKNRHVRIFAYSTKDSYDRNMWQLLARKQRFIDQALSGDSSVRTLDDISEAGQYQMAMAMTAGDERIIRLAGMKADLEKYNRLYRAHEDNKQRIRHQYSSAGMVIEANERLLPDAEKLASKVKDLSGDNFVAKAGKTQYDKRKEFGAALLEKLKHYKDVGKEGSEQVGEISGFPINLTGRIERNNDGKVIYHEAELFLSVGDDKYILARDPNDSDVGLSMRATNALAEIARRPDAMRQKIADAKSQRNALESRLDSPFQFEKELADTMAEVDKLEAELVSDSSERVATSESEAKAKAFAEKYHGEIDQRRKFTNEPYIIHPSGVVDILKTVAHTDAMVAAAWAHDTVEDTKATIEDVRRELGDEVADLVEQLTKPIDFPKLSREAQTIKLADIVHNAEAADKATEPFKSRYLAEKLQQLEYLKSGDTSLMERARNSINANLDGEAPLASRSQSTKDKFDNRIDELFNGAQASRDGVKILDRSDVLTLLGYGEKPVRVVESKITKGQLNHPKMSAEAWKKIPEWMMNPAAVFNSDTVPGSLVFIAPELIDGSPVRIIVTPNEKLGSNDVHLLINAYDAQGIIPTGKWVSQGDLRYIDKGKSRKFLTASGLQLHRVLQETYDSGNRLLLDKDLVKFRADNPLSSVHSFANKKAGGMSVESVKKATQALRNRWLGFRKIEIVQHDRDLPKEFRDRVLRSGGELGAEGWFDPKNKTVYLVADNLVSPERAVWVAVHEVVGHGGVRMLDRSVADALEFAGKNGFVQRLAKAIAADRGEEFDAKIHVDEALAELAAAILIGDPDAILERYGVKVPSSMRSNLIGMVKRVIDAVRKFIAQALGKNVDTVSDSEVSGLLLQMRGAVEGKFDAAPMADGGYAMASTPEKQIPRILRMAKKPNMESDVSTVDKIASAPFKLMGWNRIVEPAIDRLMQRTGEFIPEKVKAGMVSDYGLTQEYTDRKAEMKAAEAMLNRKSAGLVETLAGLTRAESRIAYQWMQERPDTEREKALLAQLPEDSRDTLMRLKKLVSDLGAEAVRLGQLSQDAYQRNNMAYLHRTYAKHVIEPQGAISKMLRARSLRIKGNQYKGRGIFDEVRMDYVGGDTMFWRKLQAGRADKSLVGEKVIRFERRDDSTDAMDSLPGMAKKPKGRLFEVVYWPSGQQIPAKFGDWVNAGTFEVRGTSGDKLVVWRDYTKEERERMGELDEVRYAVAQTLQLMTHDIEVGRFFNWVAKQYGKAAPEGKEVTASESMMRSYGKDEWVQVPSSNVPGTQTKKYGALAGLYIPAPVWNDIRQIGGWNAENGFAIAHEKLLQFWKKAKTAWSPAVHMNNVMSNFVIADWHDLRASDLAEALSVWANSKKDGYRQLYERFEDSGALGGMFLSNEALRDEIAKQIESMKAELTGESKNEMARMAKVMHLVTQAGMIPVKGAKAYASGMESAYQFEDSIFRLAAFLKAVRYGKPDTEAGRIARHSFLNYDINAPWIQMARHTALPFISFFYRALPMAFDTVKSKPWKVVKLLAFWHLINMIGYMASGGDEDDERELLPKEKQGSVWGVVPKMVRMPWNHEDDAPYFLDIRRWVPVGDVADVEMGAGMLPPWATPGGPSIILAEVLMANKSFFTEKEIALETDTQGEKLEKRLDHLFKGMLPNVPLPNPLNLQTPSGEVNPFGLSQGSGQSYAWSGIERSMLKREGSIGEVRNTPAAIASAVGIKVSAYPAANMDAAKKIELRKKAEEIRGEMRKIQRNYDNLENPTEQEQARYERDTERQRAKLEKVIADQ